MRSRCRRSIITMSAPARPSRMSVKTSTPKRSTPAGISVDGRDHADPRAQRARAGGCSSARRGSAGCRRRSRPSGRSIRPLRRRMVSASSSAWVGCSCAPSPALITAQSTLRASSLHRAGRMMAHDEHVGVHGVQRHRGVDQRLALLHRGGADRHVHHVGAEPLAGELEGGLRARRGLEEQVDLGQAAQSVAASCRPGGSARQARRRGRAGR